MQGRTPKGVGAAPGSEGARKSGGRTGARKAGKSASPSATEQAGLTRERAARSPVESLKASVKAAVAGKAGKGKSRKPRRD